MTSDLPKGLHEHQHETVDGFTKDYRVHRLVYYEVHVGTNEAILREKQLKRWKREWKIRLIEEMNAGWHDLSQQVA